MDIDFVISTPQPRNKYQIDHYFEHEQALSTAPQQRSGKKRKAPWSRFAHASEEDGVDLNRNILITLCSR